MKSKLFTLLASTLVITFSSCNKQDDEKPVITLSTPADEQDYEPGDTIFIEGTVTDNEALHEMVIQVIKEEGGDTVLYYTPTVHDTKSYTIDTMLIPSDTVHVHFHLKVEAWDHDDNSAEVLRTLHWAD